jgi:hypothetical protein
LTVSVDSGIFWPTVELTVPYLGNDFLLRPETEELAATVAVAHDAGVDELVALQLIRRFLSSLAWVERGHIRERLTFGTGGAPGRIGNRPEARLVNPRFNPEYMPAPSDDRARLCLALYREALNLNSPPFQFLGFFKIINVLHRTGPAQKAWINATLKTITNHEATPRISELLRLHSDVGAYLFESGRCAVAHSFADPIVDPDDPSDTMRLSQDLPVIQALADAVIEQGFEVKSLRTYRSEHLYQLEGFRSLFGGDIVAAIKSAKPLDSSTLSRLPNLSLRVRGYEEYESFERLDPRIVAVENATVRIRCAHSAGLLFVSILLDFGTEELVFDLKRDVEITDNGSALAMKHALDDNRLWRELITNGVLEVWDANNKALLGRTDPLVPINVSISGTIKRLDELRIEIAGSVGGAFRGL